MVHQPHDLDLALDVAHVLHLGLVDDLHREVLALALVALLPALLHDREVAGAQRLLIDLILLLDLRLLEKSHRSGFPASADGRRSRR